MPELNAKHTAAMAVMLLALLAASSFFFFASGQTSISPRAERVFYRGGGTLEWGTVCRLKQGGYVSVEHVTRNGIPKLGPTAPVIAANEPSDWSFLGVDPKELSSAAFPPLTEGLAVEIHGFPARDRDGEIIPGRVYAAHTVPPFMWIELHDAAKGIEAEGVIGGLSGSCVLDAQTRKLLAVVSANGFSRIEGSTHTWALVVPIREAIQEAKGAVFSTPSALLSKPMPTLKAGRWSLQYGGADGR